MNGPILRCSILHCSAILPDISNTMAWIYLILRLMVKAYTVSDLTLIAGQCNLYFMVL